MITPKEHMARFGLMKNRRYNHENVWQEIADFFFPHIANITTKKYEGQKRDRQVYDSTGTQALADLVNFIKGQLFPASNDWLRLKVEHYLIDDSVGREVDELLDSDSARMLKAISDSNFYVEANGLLTNLVGIGNGVMYVEERPPVLGWYDQKESTFGGICVQNVPPWNCWWQMGKDGMVNYFVREFKIPALEASRRWKNPGTEARRAMRSDETMMDLVCYYNFIYRNEGGKLGPRDKPWLSDWVAEGGSLGPELVQRGGYDICPYVVARWATVDGEEYGRGLGHTARPDAACVNKIRENVLLAIGPAIRPPLMANDDSQVQRPPLPGSLLSVKLNKNSFVPQYLQSGANFDAANLVGTEDRMQIRKVFMADLLNDPDTQPRSAEESRARQIRALQKLAAPAEVIEKEFLDPVIGVIAQVMMKARALPGMVQAARSLGEQNFHVKFGYESPFFTAQKASVLNRVRDLVANRAQLAALLQNPTVLDNLDLDEIFELEARYADVPMSVFKDEEALQQLRQARATQATIQQAAALQGASGAPGAPEGGL